MSGFAEAGIVAHLFMTAVFLTLVYNVLWPIGMVFFMKKTNGKVVNVKRVLNEIGFNAYPYDLVSVAFYAEGKKYLKNVKMPFRYSFLFGETRRDRYPIGSNWLIHYWPEDPSISQGRSVTYWLFGSLVMIVVLLYSWSGLISEIPQLPTWNDFSTYFQIDEIL